MEQTYLPCSTLKLFVDQDGKHISLTHKFDCQSYFNEYILESETRNDWYETVYPLTEHSGYVIECLGTMARSSTAYWLVDTKWHCSNEYETIPDGPFKKWLTAEKVSLYHRCD